MRNQKSAKPRQKNFSKKVTRIFRKFLRNSQKICKIKVKNYFFSNKGIASLREFQSGKSEKAWSRKKCRKMAKIRGGQAGTQGKKNW